jgi:hypothetical protein
MLSIPQQELLGTTVQELLGQGMIEPVVTDFASSLVIVKKKDGGDRLCVDHREL